MSPEEQRREAEKDKQRRAKQKEWEQEPDYLADAVKGAIGSLFGTNKPSADAAAREEALKRRKAQGGGR